MQDSPLGPLTWTISCSHRGVLGAHAQRHVVLDSVLARALVSTRTSFQICVMVFPYNTDRVLIGCVQVGNAVQITVDKKT